MAVAARAPTLMLAEKRQATVPPAGLTRSIDITPVAPGFGEPIQLCSAQDRAQPSVYGGGHALGAAADKDRGAGRHPVGEALGFQIQEVLNIASLSGQTRPGAVYAGDRADRVQSLQFSGVVSVVVRMALAYQQPDGAAAALGSRPMADVGEKAGQAGAVADQDQRGERIKRGMKGRVWPDARLQDRAERCALCQPPGRQA